MKKSIAAALLLAVLSSSGCMAAAVGYMGYKLADAKENSARLQAQVEREKMQLEREKAGL